MSVGLATKGIISSLGGPSFPEDYVAAEYECDVTMSAPVVDCAVDVLTVDVEVE